MKRIIFNAKYSKNLSDWREKRLSTGNRQITSLSQWTIPSLPVTDTITKRTIIKYNDNRCNAPLDANFMAHLFQFTLIFGWIIASTMPLTNSPSRHATPNATNSRNKHANWVNKTFCLYMETYLDFLLERILSSQEHIN